jgi:hypothetical protein
MDFPEDTSDEGIHPDPVTFMCTRAQTGLRGGTLNGSSDPSHVIQRAYQRLANIMGVSDPERVITEEMLGLTAAIPRPNETAAKTNLQHLQGFPGYSNAQGSGCIDVRLVGVPPNAPTSQIQQDLKNAGLVTPYNNLKRASHRTAHKRSPNVVTDQVEVTCKSTPKLWSYIAGEESLFILGNRVGVQPKMSMPNAMPHELQLDMGPPGTRDPLSPLCRFLLCAVSLGWTEADVCHFIVERIHQITGVQGVCASFRSFTTVESCVDNLPEWIPIWDRHADIRIWFSTPEQRDKVYQHFQEATHPPSLIPSHLDKDVLPIPMRLRKLAILTPRAQDPAASVRTYLPQNHGALFERLYGVTDRTALAGEMLRLWSPKNVTNICFGKEAGSDFCRFDFTTQEHAGAFLADIHTAQEHGGLPALGPFFTTWDTAVTLSAPLKCVLESDSQAMVRRTPPQRGSSHGAPDQTPTLVRFDDAQMQKQVHDVVLTVFHEASKPLIEEIRRISEDNRILHDQQRALQEAQQEAGKRETETNHKLDSMNATLAGIHAMLVTQLPKNPPPPQ